MNGVGSEVSKRHNLNITLIWVLSLAVLVMPEFEISTCRAGLQLCTAYVNLSKRVPDVSKELGTLAAMLAMPSLGKCQDSEALGLQDVGLDQSVAQATDLRAPKLRTRMHLNRGYSPSMKISLTDLLSTPPAHT